MPNFKMIGPVVSEIYHLPQLRTLGCPACPRLPRGHAAGKKNLSWSQRYPHAKFQNDWSCSFRDLPLAPAAYPRLLCAPLVAPRSCRRQKKTQVGAKGTHMPNFKMIGPVVSEIIRDILLPLAPAARPRLPCGRTADKKNLSWSQGYPHAKFQNDWSRGFRDLTLASAARPRLPCAP